jgi:integrase
MSRGEGRVFKRSRSPFWWIAYCRHGKEIRESTQIPATDENRKKATNRLKAKLGQVAAEKYGGLAFVTPSQRRITVAELLDALMEDYKARDRCSPQFLSHLKRIRDAFGFWRAVDLSAESGAVDRYINQCKDTGMAPSSINRGTQLLAQAYKCAIDRKQVSATPVIRHLPERNARQGFFEDADFTAVMEALPVYLKDFAKFGYLVGWRKGEIASLLWADVDGDVIRLRPEHSKNGQGRSVPLLDADGNLTQVGHLIERRRKARVVKTKTGEQLAGYVFHLSGQQVGDFRKAWATACKSAGLVGKLFHDLRRTAIRNMVRAGVPERVAMEISGHRTRSIFDRYNIVNERDKQEAMSRTQEYLGGSSGKRRKVAVMRKVVGQ